MNPNSTDPNSSCSDDLRGAERLSSSLRGAAARQAEAPPYTRLQPRALPAGRPTAPPPEMTGRAGWDHLLEACERYAKAAGCFIVDGSGLLVASRGIAGGASEIERIGSRIALAFDIADQMADHPCQHIAVDLAGRCLTGIRLPAGEGEGLTLGILTAAPLDPALLPGLLQRP